MPHLDITGLRSGSLVVRARRTEDGRKSAWQCDCDCGAVVIRGLTSLRNGSAKSCGCHLFLDLSGRSYGRLIVISQAGTDVRGKQMWMCACTCGAVTITNGASLQYGSTRSCGCLSIEAARQTSLTKFVDLTGKTFGWLTVIERAQANIKSWAAWRCVCKCGNSVVKAGAHLRAGVIVSCGCAKNKSRNTAALLSESVRAKSAVNGAKRRAIQSGNGGSFTALQIIDLYKTQKGRCAEPSCRCLLNGKFHRDHIIPVSLGGTSYIKNIQLLCGQCNNRKYAQHPLDWARKMGRLL